MQRKNEDLIDASQFGYVEMVATLLKSKADVACVDEHGDTALFNAAANGHVEIVKMLLEHKADVNYINKGIPGISALLRTIYEGDHAEVVQTLLKNRADVGYINNWGNSALSEAQRGGRTNIDRVIKEFIVKEFQEQKLIEQSRSNNKKVCPDENSQRGDKLMQRQEPGSLSLNLKHEGETTYISEQKIKGSEKMASTHITRSHFGNLTTHLVSSKTSPEVQRAAVDKMLEQLRRAHTKKSINSTREIQQQLRSEGPQNLNFKNKQDITSQPLIFNEPILHLKNIPFTSDVLSFHIGDNQTSIQGLQKQTPQSVDSTLDQEKQTSYYPPDRLKI